MLLAGKNKIVAHGELREHLQELEGSAHAEAIKIAWPHPGRGSAVDADLPAIRR